MAAPNSNSTPSPQTISIVVLGTDALLAALPATAVQLAHACLRAGFATVVPASWGDELLAAAVMKRLPAYGEQPVIQCSCPIVAHRLLSVGGDLRPAMLGLVAPPVAVARYVRALSPTPARITYVGSCPGANDESIDIRMRPDAFLGLLADRDIALAEQPQVFESIIPPDRRRFRSLPGGVPTAETLWNGSGSRTLVELEGDDLVAEVAQHLLSGRNVLIDVAPHLGCACSGARGDVPARQARPAVSALEPPRASMPVVEEHAPIELGLNVPAAPRTPIDVGAVSTPPAEPRASGSAQAPANTMPLGHRISPVHGVGAITEVRQPRSSNPAIQRPVMGSLPVARDGDGRRSLPRAYVARRRSSPRGIPAVPAPDDEVSSTGTTERSGAAARDQTPVAAPIPIVLDRAMDPPLSPQAVGLGLASSGSGFSRRQLLMIAAAFVLLALSMSAVVGVIVGRLVRLPPAITSPR